MSSLFNGLAGLVLAVFSFAASASAAQIVVDWPTGATGSYFLPGNAGMPKPASVSGTYTIEDNKNTRLVGPGFDISFIAENGKINFPNPGMGGKLRPEDFGVCFDPATKTFSFVTVDIHFDIKDCDIKPLIFGKPVDAPSATYTIVYGTHSMLIGGAALPFKVDDRGNIVLQKTMKGITARDNTISIRGIPLNVVTSQTGWSIHGWNQKGSSGNNTIYVVPGDYVFLPGKTKIPFSVNDEGFVALDKNGPYAEVINLGTSDGSPQTKITIPDGEAKYAARIKQEQVDQQLRNRIFESSASAKWRKDIELKEMMRVYDFPEEQLNYPLELPSGISERNLKLLLFTERAVRLIPFQLSTRDGKQIISFRSDLPRGEKRIFRLVSGFDSKDIPSFAPSAPSLVKTSNPQEAILSNGILAVKIPSGRMTFPGEGKPLSATPAPILAIGQNSIEPRHWAATGSFNAPNSLCVTSIDAKTVESGPLFIIYEVVYTFADHKTYTAKLELRANEFYVRIADSAKGFAPANAAFFHLDYGKGLLDPDRRLVATNGGYDTAGGYPSRSGAYDKNTTKDGKLDYCLGLFTPNALGVMRATVFYREEGPEALLLSLHRLAEWRTYERALWSSLGAFENLRFYSKGEQKYLTAGISGENRFWVLGVEPRAKVIRNNLPGTLNAPAAGPEARLCNQLNDWSLDAYKDRAITWDEKLDSTPFFSVEADGPFKKYSFDDYKTYHQKGNFFQWLVNDSWDFGALAGAVSFRGMPDRFGSYAASRADWTPEQREEIRQVLLWFAASSEGDANQPHHSMLSGHPNFVMDVKATLPIACATFPTYPGARKWRDSFMEFYNEWLDKYSRKDVPDLHTIGGRWSENIACYVGQCFVGLQCSQNALRNFDGTGLAQNPQLQCIIRWMRDSFMSPHDGVRMIPPEGAHSSAFEPGGRFWKSFFSLCAEISPEAPQLSREMHWIETNGKEGQKPDIHSGLYTDYGPVFHYDFGGPHESYAHLQNINGMNYRWGNAGIVYYGAKNKVWSFNNVETNGDQFNWNALSAFNVNGKGLSAVPTDQVLYDFDFAQFYRQPGKEGDPYVARGLMLLRDDYLVLSDEVRDPSIPGTFNWVCTYELPEIYQLKPGAPMNDSTHVDPPQRPDNRPGLVGKIRSYSGKGDFLTIVAPTKIHPESRPYGAEVSGEYIFASQKPTTFKDKTLTFTGSYGYARSNQLALFQGEQIGLNGFEIHRNGGDFGISAELNKGQISGRIAGRSGGNISIFLSPDCPQPRKVLVSVNGATVPSTINGRTITFPVDITQKDGMKNYTVSF